MVKLFVKYGKKMSRIGQKPVVIPEGVTVKVTGNEVVVIGPLGNLKQLVRPEIKVKISENQVLVERQNDQRQSRALHGLTRSLISNMVEGVTNGFSKTLKLVGTGYRVKDAGEKINLSLGFSHPVVLEAIPGTKLEVQGENVIKISGLDKALVSQMAAKIRAIRPPEPYKGKGIRYQDEEVKIKPGKAGKVGAAGGFETGGGEQ